MYIYTPNKMVKVNWILVSGVLIVIAIIFVVSQHFDTFGTGKGGGGRRGGGRTGGRTGGRMSTGASKAPSRGPSRGPSSSPRGSRPQISSSPSMGTVKGSASPSPSLGGSRSVAGSTLSKPIMGGGISGMQPRAQPNLTSPSIAKPGVTVPSISKPGISAPSLSKPGLKAPGLSEPQPSKIPGISGGKTLEPSLLDAEEGIAPVAPMVMGDDKGIGAGKGAVGIEEAKAEAEGPDIDPGAPDVEPVEPENGGNGNGGDDGGDNGGEEEVDENGDIIININECGECCDGGCGNDWWWWGSGYNPWSWWGWGSIPAETVYVYNEDPNWVLYWKLTPNVDNVVGKQFLGSFNPAYNGVCFSNDPTFFDKAQALIDIVESNDTTANVAMFRGEKDGDNQGQCTVDLYYIPDTSNLPEAVETQPKSKKYYQDNFHSWGTLVKLN